jgi:hypothetical protein
MVNMASYLFGKSAAPILIFIGAFLIGLSFIGWQLIKERKAEGYTDWNKWFLLSLSLLAVLSVISFIYFVIY